MEDKKENICAGGPRLIFAYSGPQAKSMCVILP